jgi:hypothetical protein
MVDNFSMRGTLNAAAGCLPANDKARQKSLSQLQPSLLLLPDFACRHYHTLPDLAAFCLLPSVKTILPPLHRLGAPLCALTGRLNLYY